MQPSTAYFLSIILSLVLCAVSVSLTILREPAIGQNCQALLSISGLVNTAREPKNHQRKAYDCNCSLFISCLRSVMAVHEIFGQAQYRASQSLIGRLRHLESKPRFENDLKDCVSRMLNIRIKEPVGDRLVRFLVSYLQSSSEHVTSILSALLPYLSAKDKTIRFRATQIVAQAINSLDAIDDELYHDIRQVLMKRIRDKIPGVRIQAVIGLGTTGRKRDGRQSERR